MTLSASGAYRLDEETNFDPFVDQMPYLPIKRVKEFHRRARSLVRDRTADQQRSTVETIRWLEHEYFFTEKEQWIQRQLDTGGAILRYLHPDDQNEYGLRELEAHRPFEISSSEFDFSSEENTGVLEALENSLELFNLDEMDLPNAAAYEYVAILAIDLIGQAVRSYRDTSIDWPEDLRGDREMIRLQALANDAVDIAEAVSRAEDLRNQHQANRRLKRLLRDNELKLLPAMAEEMTKQRVSLSAAMAARARHEREHGLNITAALACWDEEGHNFSSKSAFARIKCRNYSVTERTLFKWITEHEKKKNVTE